MRLLLDTHVFLWYISGDSRLPSAFRTAVRDPENEVFLSVVSLWESLIKVQIGKLSFPTSPSTFLQEQRELHRIGTLALEEKAVGRLLELPAHHRDPFDRMLICQAIEHELQFVTVDAMLSMYPVQLLKS